MAKKHIFTSKPIVHHKIVRGGALNILLKQHWNKPDFAYGSQMVLDNANIAPQFKLKSSRPELTKSNLVGGKTNYSKPTTHIATHEKPYSHPESISTGGTLLNSIKIPQQKIDMAVKKKINNIKFSI
jgi:hypothetical protein